MKREDKLGQAFEQTGLLIEQSITNSAPKLERLIDKFIAWVERKLD